MTIFVEIPHQTTPTVYENDVCLTSQEEQRDLSSFFEFETALEAAKYLYNIKGHGYLKAFDRVRPFLTDEEALEVGFDK